MSEKNIKTAIPEKSKGKGLKNNWQLTTMEQKKPYKPNKTELP